MPFFERSNASMGSAKEWQLMAGHFFSAATDSKCFLWSLAASTASFVLLYVPCSSVGHQHGPHRMSQIEQGQQVAQLPQQGLEQLGLLVACSVYTEPPKTALVN